MEHSETMAILVGANSPTRLTPMPKELEVWVYLDEDGKIEGFSHNTPMNAQLHIQKFGEDN